MKQKNKKNAIIIGAGGHCRVISSMLISLRKYESIKILDLSEPKEKKILNLDVEKINENLSSYRTDINDFYLAIGENKLREIWWKKLENIKASRPSLVSDSALIEKNSMIGDGNIICQNSYLGVLTKLGNNNIINSGSIIDHETIIGSNCHIAPGSVIAGRVTIEDNCFIGAGAVIKDNLSISKNSIIGSGSVLLESIDVNSSMFAGVPAKFKKNI